MSLLFSVEWPSRAFLYAELREAGVDVYGVDRLEDLREALWRWPGRFRGILVDAAGISGANLESLGNLAARAGLFVLALAGPWDRERVRAAVPTARILGKPVSVGQVVDAVRELLGGEAAGRLGG
ncbi:hypothetical protein [Deferrisoma sp.]